MAASSALLVAATAAGCTEDESADPRPLEDACVEVDAPGPVGSCPASFTVDGITYFHGCTAAIPDAVAEEAFAEGTFGGQEITAHVLRGLDPRVALAVDIPGGGCTNEQPTPLSEWSVAFNSDPDVGAVEALCPYQLPRLDCG